MSQLVADLLSCTLIKLSIFSMTRPPLTVQESRSVAHSAHGVSRSQLMKAFQSMLMQNVPRRSHNCLQEIFVAFVRR
jgi:hypothetical protein